MAHGRLLAAVLYFLVEFLLIIVASRLLGEHKGIVRCLLGALVAGVFAALCLMPRTAFLAGYWWRLGRLILTGILAFGIRPPAWRQICLLGLLSLAMEGLVTALNAKGIWGFLAGVAWAFMGGYALFPRRKNALVPVELAHRGKRLRIMALRDTGNTLCDPVTGRPVLVVSARVAGELPGLTAEQLQNPVESMGSYPGLRLIPYRAVGRSQGMLLGMKVDMIRIDRNRGSGLVAFAPEGLEDAEGYEALTGGAI